MGDLDPLVVALTIERERLQLGIREAARRIGLRHPGRLSEWELGINSPTLTSLRRWAAGLGCDLALISLPRQAAALHTDQHDGRTETA